MQSNLPLLTVAIPTYNRAQSLGRLLRVLQEQILGDSRVEVLVSDNASTDATPDVVESARKQGAAIRYIRNATNLGADRNIIQCFGSAVGEYVWIFSDDDLLAPGAVRRILDAISRDTYDLVFVTPIFFKGEFNGHKPFSPIPDLEFTRAEDFARQVHVLLTFVSGLVMNKKAICSAPHRPFESLYDTCLAQLGPSFTALNHHRKSLVIRDPLIAATANTRVGYTVSEVFGTNLAAIANEWLEDASVRDAIFNGTIQKFLPSWILMSRSRIASDVAEDPHRVLRSCFGKYARYWIFDYPICALPLPLAEAWLTCVRAFNKVGTLRMFAT